MNFLGYFFLTANIILWSVGNILIKIIYIWKYSFQKPFFIIYVSYSSYLIYWLKLLWSRKKAKEKTNFNFFYAYKKEIRMALIFVPITFIDTYFFEKGCLYTSIASAVVITGISTVFTVIFSKLILFSEFNIFKIVSIIASVVGTIFVALSDKDEKQEINPILGDIYAVIAQIFFSLSTVLMNKLIPNSDSDFDWQIYFALMGIFYLIGLFPLFFIFNFTGIEIFEFPSFYNWILILCFGLFNCVLGDFSLNKSSVLLGPLITDIGLTLITPIVMISDIWIEKISFSVTYLVGFVIIIYSVILITFDDIITEKISKIAKIPKIPIDLYSYNSLLCNHIRYSILKR